MNQSTSSTDMAEATMDAPIPPNQAVAMTAGQNNTKIARWSDDTIGIVANSDTSGATTATAYRNTSDLCSGTRTVMAWLAETCLRSVESRLGGLGGTSGGVEPLGGVAIVIRARVRCNEHGATEADPQGEANYDVV
jgi:hypothetical protein